MTEATTHQLHIGDRVRIVDTNPAWDGFTGTVSASTAEQHADDPATLDERGMLPITLDSGGTVYGGLDGVVPLTYDYAIISGGWKVEQRRQTTEAMTTPGLDAAWGAAYRWEFRLLSKQRVQARLHTWEEFWGAPTLEILLERILAKTICRVGELPADAQPIAHETLVERGYIAADELLTASALWVAERKGYVALWYATVTAIVPESEVWHLSRGIEARPHERDAVAPLRSARDQLLWIADHDNWM